MLHLRSAFSVGIVFGIVAAATASLAIASPRQGASRPASLRDFARHHPRPPTSASSQLLRRGTDSTNATFTSLWYASSYTNGANPPEFIEGDTAGQSVIIGGSNGTDNNSPVSSCPIAFIGGAAVAGEADTGWQSKAQIVDFDTVELALDDDVVLPYYLERKDLTKIKRVIIVLQGAPRDTWRYANLVRYSGLCAVSNADYEVNFEDYAVAAPLLWNTLDTAAGGASANQAVWDGSGWSSGGLTAGPGDASYTSFKVLDLLISSFFSQTTYPALTSVVIAGHSAGGMAAQRYAMLREKADGEDENMKWWVGNAGSYAWPVDSRPVPDPVTAAVCKSSNCEITAACDAKKNEWPYGINVTDPDSMNIYARSRFVAGEKDEILSRYLDRRVLYSLGLDDYGAGDTHCQAQYQGDSHITRGQNLAAVLATLDAPNHVVAYVVNATHVDEEMYIDYTTQSWLFNEGINDARNTSTSTSNTSSTSKTSHKETSSASSSGSSSSATAVTAGLHPQLIGVLSTLVALALGVSHVLSVSA